MNARKYPRTLEEAFGPYARGPVEEKPEPMPLGHRVLNVAMPLLLAFLLGAIAVGGK